MTKSCRRPLRGSAPRPLLVALSASGSGCSLGPGTCATRFPVCCSGGAAGASRPARPLLHGLQVRGRPGHQPLKAGSARTARGLGVGVTILPTHWVSLPGFSASFLTQMVPGDIVETRLLEPVSANGLICIFMVHFNQFKLTVVARITPCEQTAEWAPCWQRWGCSGCGAHQNRCRPASPPECTPPAKGRVHEVMVSPGMCLLENSPPPSV